MKTQEMLNLLETSSGLDYEIYLNTQKLLACQKPFSEFANDDELQFQIVHQVEELWMKLIGYSVIKAVEYLESDKLGRAHSVLGRAQRTLRLMTDQLDLLETMSPHDYQAIRIQLGNGSGQESPGFRALLKIIPELWPAFSKTLKGQSMIELYDAKYTHDIRYLLAEDLIELDELFQKFLFHHMQLIGRSIGKEANSLKGRPVEQLMARIQHSFFPELWKVRSTMTDAWGASYGRVRPSLDAGAAN